jgi:transposase
MTGSQYRQAIPTKLSLEQFEQFVLPHLSRGRRGPAPTLALHPLFNYVLQMLYTGCQWKALAAIKMNAQGLPEIHYTRIYRILRRWQADGCIERIFAGPVRKLHQDGRLDIMVIHGDGTTTAAKKGGDTWDTADTNISRATKSSPSAIGTATSSRHSLPLRAIAMNRPCCVMRCPN